MAEWHLSNAMRKQLSRGPNADIEISVNTHFDFRQANDATLVNNKKERTVRGPFPLCFLAEIKDV